MADTIEIQHLPLLQGRAALKNQEEGGIPSISAVLDTRWRASWKEKFLDPGENAKFLTEIRKIISSRTEIASQRDIYYAIRGAHPDWTYKGQPLGQEFYQHLVLWLMEKFQLQSGLTIQSVGVWPGLRGYITGDGVISTPYRGRIPLTAKPTLIFDLADDGVTFATNAKKVIHFEKEAGFEGLTSGNFPKFIEAIFSTAQGQLTEASHKFLRKAEDAGFGLWAVHDGDVSGLQMQLSYGMATKSNCYMPSEFYPRLVKPLGFYPAIGEALNLPPEAVSENDEKMFDNLMDLLEGKTRTYPELRRYKLADDVGVLIQEKKKWEFQALNAIHESAPKIYLLEGLRVHNDEVKHVPPAESIKDGAYAAARTSALLKADSAIEGLARSLLEAAVPKVVAALKESLKDEITLYDLEVQKALRTLNAVDPEAFREFVKRQLVSKPEKYSVDVIKALGLSLISASFVPRAELDFTYEVKDISASVTVNTSAPRADLPYTTKTTLVNSIESQIIPDARTRATVVTRIRTALENRFGKPTESW